MRLIDAEELEKALIGVLPYKYVTERVVKAMPTIEAIPIEWLKEWGYKHFANYYHNISFETVIDGAINDYRKWWRKEQSDETD